MADAKDELTGNWEPIAVNNGKIKKDDGTEQDITRVIMREKATGHLRSWATDGKFSLDELKGQKKGEA